MKKLYYHIASTLNEDNQWVCTYCGKIIEEGGLSSEPCSISTAAQSIYEDIRFEISVWNCKANLYCFNENQQTGERQYYEIVADDDIKQKIKELAEKSVYAAGGAINFSGIYPLSYEFEEFLAENIKSQKIKFVEIS